MQVEINRAGGNVETMSISEFTRWMCLVEAFDILGKKAEDLKLDVDKLIKPLAIENFIKERYPSMLHDVECEIKLGNL
jgi:hypothetical protein